MLLLPIFISSLCTSLGALPILLVKNVSHKSKDTLLAYTAGIMVAASAYGLIPSALKLSNMVVLVSGILVGTFVLTLIESLLPHIDLDHSNQPSGNSTVILLFLIAMSIHNLPEGLSVGISTLNGANSIGSLVAFAIGLQNVPDGFLVALFLVTQGIRPINAFLLSSLTGLIEMCAGLVGFIFGGAFENIVPFGLAFAAGAMLFVVYKELIPESHGDGNERTATWAFIIGFITMILLTEWFR
ncbi:ZIP family metal transporter [Gracilibacillus saliphilus]|uniref:ZIP family metal transporter n=1 Tax=Gracilibacillus saliphilus TaxID=543890 RepID=UPI0013D3CF8F|nr:ZIP family metal transporter [Gracilibacillus saliphilus]